MDINIRAIIEILRVNGDNLVADMLTDSTLEIKESGAFGSRVNSIKSTAIISSSVTNSAKLNGLSQSEKDKITNAMLQIYPVVDDAPEIVEVVFKALVDKYDESLTTIKQDESPQGKYIDDAIDEEIEELEIRNGLFVLRDKEFLANISENKKRLENRFVFENDYIEFFPSSFYELEHLHYIEFTNCKIVSFPTDLHRLRNLRHISIEDSIILNDPKDIKLPPSIISIDFTNSHLKSVPFDFRRQENLEHVNFSYNKLKSVPDSLFELKSLIYLNLEGNKLKYLPKNINNLEALITFELSGNRLKNLPEGLSELANLKTLHVSFNKLVSLPDSISRLISLENLSIHSNRLNSLPTSFSTLRKLNFLSFEDNPFLDMPEIKEKKIIELFYYLNEQTQNKLISTFWEVPESFKVAFQQYLNYFSEFVYKLHDEHLIFEVQKTATGLKLVTESTATLSVQRINELLEMYMSSDRDFVAPEEGYNIRQEVELMELKSDLKLEKQHLLFKLQHQTEKLELYKKMMDSKEREIEDLKLTIRFFQDTLTPAHLRLLPKSTDAYNPYIEMKYTKVFDDQFRNFETQINKIAQAVNDDLSLSSEQRKQANIAIAEMLEEIRHDKPNKTTFSRTIEATKSITSISTQLIQLWKDIEDATNE